jgi:hypothetical protein
MSDRPRPARDERGFVTIQYVLATGCSLILLVMIANLMVDLYARGAVRDALDEGARAGAVVDGGVTACEHRARTVVATLVHGRTREHISVTCEDRGDGWMRATARVRLRSWLPGVPDWSFTARAVARQDR